MNFTYLNQLLFATAQVATLTAIIFSSLIILSTEKKGNPRQNPTVRIMGMKRAMILTPLLKPAITDR